MQQGGGGLLHAQPGGNLHQLRGGNERVLGIAAQHAHRGHRVARGKPGDARAQLLHSTRGLAARSEWQRGLINALAEVDLDEVDPDSLNTDQHLPRPRRGNGQIGQLKNFRAACLVNLDCFHDRFRMHYCPVRLQSKMTAEQASSLTTLKKSQTNWARRAIQEAPCDVARLATAPGTRLSRQCDGHHHRRRWLAARCALFREPVPRAPMRARRLAPVRWYPHSVHPRFWHRRIHPNLESD